MLTAIANLLSFLCSLRTWTIPPSRPRIAAPSRAAGDVDDAPPNGFDRPSASCGVKRYLQRAQLAALLNWARALG
jgi:hypothetical protein